MKGVETLFSEKYSLYK